jgi:hypothetical protein
MPKLVVNGALLQCNQGTIPSPLAVLPVNRSLGVMQNAATIQDFVPNVNIAPFGMCASLANPQVAAATTAQLGVLSPQPCNPVTTAPWVPGAVKTLINNQPALLDTCKCMCAWAGTIAVTFPGEATIEVE